ncbi:HAD family phosphatase [Olsenella sp. DSM 107455]|uniref:HAD family phosphatase n=1 Tax=Thermophilibacter gallinarum TaxID=2779357 RepID=A0ABR9QR47_9ACTN|nr:HAD family phosphatase [Thermophilibacter gallinarum]MBE5023556.1 HAD family phosphatase [Thermophilibacter gallinarum]
MGKPVRNVIFDMGNVLMTFNGPYFASCFTDTPEDAALLNAALFGSPLWTLLDSGTIGHETMTRYAEHHLPERLHPNLHECLAHWPERSEAISDVNELGIRLKEEGFGVYVLSNASTRIMEQLGHAPVIPYVDGVVVSANERMMKPDPSIYQLLCERYDLDPAECLFVDDNEDNCIGARVAGMHAYHFTGDVAELEAAVRQLV